MSPMQEQGVPIVGRSPDEEDPTALPSRPAPGLEEAKADVSVLLERLKHLQAEFENYKKRAVRERAALEERTSDREICALLPAYDSLRRALEHMERDGDAQSFLEGVRRVAGQFEQILAQREVAPVSCVGERFDPAYHEALLCVPSDLEKDVILEEFERGYLRSGRVLRPSKVKVSGGSPASKEEAR